VFIDSHCHLDKLDLSLFDGQFANVIAKAKAAKVERMLCIGVTLEEFPAMQALVADYPEVVISCGAHPLYIANHDLAREQLLAYAQQDNVVAIGETGLDYYYDATHKAQQQQSFSYHVEVARQLNKPLIIHTRDAQQDTLDILRNGGADQCGGVLHCFTESLEMAEQAIEQLGFYISISGIVSFANAKALREVVKALPLERLLIETDSPWLAPVPHRGQQNQPAFVADVARCIADIKGLSVERVAEQTKENFYQLFNRARLGYTAD
jgi:TatD DNase family protein